MSDADNGAVKHDDFGDGDDTPELGQESTLALVAQFAAMLLAGIVVGAVAVGVL